MAKPIETTMDALLRLAKRDSAARLSAVQNESCIYRNRLSQMTQEQLDAEIKSQPDDGKKGMALTEWRERRMARLS